MIEVRVRLVVLEGRGVAVSVDLPLDTSIPTTLDAALLPLPVLQLQGLLQQLRDRLERFQLMQVCSINTQHTAEQAISPQHLGAVPAIETHHQKP